MVRGDVYEGEEVTKVLGMHPDQIERRKREAAVRLSCKIEDVFAVLESREKLPKDLEQLKRFLRDNPRPSRLYRTHL